MSVGKVLAVGFATAVLGVAAAACGGSGKSGDKVAGVTSGSSAPKASASAAAANGREAVLNFAKCMREHGVDMADPDVSGDNFAMMLPDGTDPRAAQGAQEACKHLLPNGGEPDGKMNDPQMTQKMRDLAKCMRENGVPNFPDPGDDGGVMFDAGSGLNPDDPAFKAAQEKCAKFQPDGGKGPMKVNP